MPFVCMQSRGEWSNAGFGGAAGDEGEERRVIRKPYGDQDAGQDRPGRVPRASAPCCSVARLQRLGVAKFD